MGLSASDGFKGLVALKGKKVLLFTATLINYYRDAFCKAFDLPPTAIVHPRSSMELINACDIHQSIDVHMHGSKRGAMADLI